MKTLLQRQSITSQGGFYEPKEGHTKVRQEHHCEQQEVHRIHGRGTSRDEGVPPRAEGFRGPRPARGQGGRGKRRAREDCRVAGIGSRHGQAAPRDHQSQRARPLAEDLVRDAAYAKDGEVVCFFQPAQKFKTRYATFGFSDAANLDEGALWPVAFALKELTAAEEARIGALVKKAVS